MALSTRTMVQDRKKALLLLCLCLLALSVTYRMLNPFRQEKVAVSTFPKTVSQGPREGSKGPDQPVPFDGDVRVELFLSPPVHSGKVHKNVFQRLEETALPGTHVLHEGPVLNDPTLPPESDKRLQVKEDLSRFRTFGYLQGKDVKIMFLERGKDILLIREGDRIDGKYLVKSITEKHLLIRAESIGEDVRIELGDF